jgi:diguanylate cyclase (GGDEF)-like protein
LETVVYAADRTPRVGPARAPEDTGIPEPVGWEDAVTGLEGPDFWRRTLVAEVARSTRYQRPLTVVLLEIGGMDSLLRLWGADVARTTLREVGQCVRRMSRTSDHCTRIAPARFGIVLTETDEIAAINFVERVREAGPRSLPRVADTVRFSFGWASPKGSEAADALVRRAERLLQADSSD